LAVWREAAEHIPAALEKLGAEKVEFVSRLSDGEANELLGAVFQRFAIPRLAPLLDPGVGVQLVARKNEPNVASRLQLRQVQLPSAPWQKVITESRAQQLSVAQHRFLGLSLMLLRAPASVRSKTFAHQAERWQLQVQAKAESTTDTKVLPSRTTNGSTQNEIVNFSSKSQANESTTRNPTKKTGQRDIISSASHLARTDAVHDQETADPRGLPRQDHLHEPAVTDREDMNASRSQGIVITEPSAFVTQAKELNQTPDDRGKVAREPRAATVAVSNETGATTGESVSPNLIAERWEAEGLESDIVDFFADDGPSEIIAQCETQYAGIFYLLNLGIYLGLYGDFTRPTAPGIELNIWDFVALIGRELAGPEIENDPAWLLLVRLSGREADLDELWLPEVSGEQILFSNNKSQDVKMWLAQLLPLIRHRLRLAFGMDQNTDPGPLLVSHAGTVKVTPTHVDVAFDLATLPILIRLAGLDRDPGWVPAAGRFVAFHFN
jgi:hypothetical protein